jgi:hypothetical protein
MRYSPGVLERVGSKAARRGVDAAKARGLGSSSGGLSLPSHALSYASPTEAQTSLSTVLCRFVSRTSPGVAANEVALKPWSFVERTLENIIFADFA